MPQNRPSPIYVNGYNNEYSDNAANDGDVYLEQPVRTPTNQFVGDDDNNGGYQQQPVRRPANQYVANDYNNGGYQQQPVRRPANQYAGNNGYSQYQNDRGYNSYPANRGYNGLQIPSLDGFFRNPVGTGLGLANSIFGMFGWYLMVKIFESFVTITSHSILVLQFDIVEVRAVQSLHIH